MPNLSLKKEEVKAYADRFASTRVVILGDIMLDRYYWGVVDRISPEAPVPVVKITRRSSRLGGAANVAANLQDLGVKVSLLGVTGNDPAGEELRGMLDQSGLEHDGVLSDPSRPTTEKTRIIAQSQQVVRADFEVETPVPDDLRSAFLEMLTKRAARGDALVISDYGKGVVREDSLKEAIAIWKSRGKPVLVDPHIGHFHWYRGATIVTPNAREATSFYGAFLDGGTNLEQAGFRIKEALELNALLITRGEEGMSLFHGDAEHLLVPTVAKEVFDVTGAGDTVISVLAAGLGAGVDLVDSVVMANQAAGEVVKEIGTSTLTKEMFVNAFV